MRITYDFMKSEEGLKFDKWLDKNSTIFYMNHIEFGKQMFGIADIELYLDNEKHYRLIYNEYLEYKKRCINGIK